MVRQQCLSSTLQTANGPAQAQEWIELGARALYVLKNFC